MTGDPPKKHREARMPPYPVDERVVAEAHRLAAEDLGRDLFAVAEILARQGHYGPDGRPYPVRLMAKLLDEELKERCVEHWQAAARDAIES